MNQNERLDYLINELVHENQKYHGMKIPSQENEKKHVFRSLVNVRMPGGVRAAFLKIQDEYLQEEIRRKGITTMHALQPIRENTFLWQGDITTLEVDAIVNAANRQMLGCFIPSHSCIDNAIHTYAGVQLRNECNEIMERQGHPEPTGSAKSTCAYNLPSKHILHTVGPIITRKVRTEDRRLLESCYTSCLELAMEKSLSTIAFCCISTGEFRFPNEIAAEIAVQTVAQFQKEHDGSMKVIFNVYKKEDYEIYEKLLR